MNDSILIIDAHNLAYRAHYKFNLTTDSGTPSGVAYGFLYILNSLVRKFSPRQVHVVFDGGRSPIRLGVWPEYKKRDDKLGADKELFYTQISDIQGILPSLGCYVYRSPKVEADDIIFQIWKSTPELRKTIVSSDKDFVQLLDNHTKILNPFKDLLVTILNVKKEYGFTEKEFVDYLILNGDKSDNIPGVPGMGDKRIRIFLDQYGSIKNFMEDNDKYLGRYEILPVYNRNRKLIDLAWYYKRFPTTEPYTKGDFSELPREFIRKYQLRSFIKSEFLKPFENL